MTAPGMLPKSGAGCPTSERVASRGQGMLTDAAGRFQGWARLWSRRSIKERRIQLLLLVGGVIVFSAIAFVRGAGSALTFVGYPGVFLLSVLGSGALILPLPAVASVCGMSVVLTPFIVGIVAGAGETIGELTGYAVGYGSQEVFKGSRYRRLYRKARGWMKERGTIVLLVVSIVPNPIFDVIGIAAGATRFPIRRFIATVAIGKTIKGVLIAHACYYGLSQLPWVG